MNRYLLLLVSPLFALQACSEPKTEAPSVKPSAGAAKLVLAADPGAAVGVVAAKKGGPKKSVVVEGRVQDITKGFAMLKLITKEMDYCGQVDKADKCPTPWDYCCDSKDDIVANTLLVEFRGGDGKPIATPALPKTRLCDLLKVTGDLTKDEHGNLVLVASGLFQVERPTLPDYVKWPQ